jgi:hypothetical protein
LGRAEVFTGQSDLTITTYPYLSLLVVTDPTFLNGENERRSNAMRLPRRLTRIVLILTLAAASLAAVAAPAQAATHPGNHCTSHAWGAGTLVVTCASIHVPDTADLAAAHGEARHTRGPGPIKVRITAVQLWHYNPNGPDRLIHRGPATPWENDHAYSHSEYCSWAPNGGFTATVYALVGVDAVGQGASYHWTVRSYNVNFPAVFMSSC